MQILTQPWNGPADWEEYERFVATDGADVPRAQWQVVPYELGLGVVARF